jgi:hypothetical protein
MEAEIVELVIVETAYHAPDIPTDDALMKFDQFRDRIGRQSVAHEPFQRTTDRFEKKSKPLPR